MLSDTVVSTCRRHCILYRRQNCRQFVARMLLDTMGYKSTVTNSNYDAEIQPQVSRTSNLYPATCVRRHICIRIQVARLEYMFPYDMCPNVRVMSRTVSGNEFQIEEPEMAKLYNPYRANRLRGIVRS